jgi:type I restriction enzyme R subunit
VRKAHEQKIDLLNPDELVNVGWDKDNKDKANETVTAFKEWIESHKDEIVALQIFYDQPFRRRELTFTMIKELVEKILQEKPTLAPMSVWRAYEQLESVSGQPKNEMVALVSLIRKVAGIDTALTPYDKTVDRNFQQWLFKKQAGTLKFSKEQMDWLYMLKEQIATSVHIEADDLDYTPFDAKGGRGKMWQLFGDDMETIINELNEALAA